VPSADTLNHYTPKVRKNSSTTTYTNPLNVDRHNVNCSHQFLPYIISLNRTVATDKVTMEIVVHIYYCCYGSKHVANSDLLNSEPTWFT